MSFSLFLLMGFGLWGVVVLLPPWVVCFFRPNTLRWVLIAGVVISFGVLLYSFTGSDPDGDWGRTGDILALGSFVFTMLVWALGACAGRSLGRRRVLRKEATQPTPEDRPLLPPE
jgi:hypothetical protein